MKERYETSKSRKIAGHVRQYGLSTGANVGDFGSPDHSRAAGQTGKVTQPESQQFSRGRLLREAETRFFFARFHVDVR